MGQQGLIISPARVREHRLWRERESAASPRARAAQDVGFGLGAWVASGEAGNRGSGQDEDAASEHEPTAGSSMGQQVPTTSPARVREHRLWRERE
eukprot:CAMPEP_0202344252 /NCGR_PEP_ID=MMETSP1126-20121109/4024_1 /ASSEMBLY_ACC=CAM_ASM_000457 /TAXON_ID=3047 /ORGANISM="Dunaliella tertiolecta, Strain CCMP1320" /LENGTH=94 /DNA_ID=CAMNT_0048935437 /DNA_START=12 /DNA_END=293 /DNA_ORIENTATION=-